MMYWVVFVVATYITSDKLLQNIAVAFTNCGERQITQKCQSQQNVALRYLEISFVSTT